MVSVVALTLLGAGILAAFSGEADIHKRAIRINVGGGAVTTLTGVQWGADSAYRGGARVLAGSDQRVHPRRNMLVTARVGKQFNYQVPIANGRYMVRLIMMETSPLLPGQRVFSAAAEGVPIFSGLDLAATAGPYVEARRSVVVDVGDGVLRIDLWASKGQAALSGIVIFRSAAALGPRAVHRPTSSEQCLPATIYAGMSSTGSSAAIRCADKWKRAKQTPVVNVAKPAKGNGGRNGEPTQPPFVTPTPAPKPTPTATRPVPVNSPTPNAHGVVIGMNDHPIWVPIAQQDASLDLLAEAGVQALRMDVPWDVVEPTQGQYDSRRLAMLDHYISGLHARGIDPLLIVLHAPKWENGSSDPNVPPRSDADYADFLEFLIKRYRGEVHEYEIWNEPNGGWAWTNPDPVRYTALLKAAYTRAKAVDPSVTILGPSLSGPDFASYLERLYKAGAGHYFDVFSMHGYGDIDRGAYPGATYPLDPSRIFQEFEKKIYPVMKKYGDADKPIWWTEMGMTTTEGANTEATQADYLVRAFQAASKFNIDRLYWYTWMDGNGSGVEGRYGIVRDVTATSSSVKPAYDALKGLAK